jgi:hypothetical protein
MACGGATFQTVASPGFSDEPPTVIITSEKATHKSMTLPSLCVHYTSFLWALCQELVRSTSQRFVA